MLKKFLILFFVVFSALLPLKSFAADASVTTQAELTTAVADNTVDVINVEADFNVTAPQTIARDITIKSNPPDGSTVTAYTLDGQDTNNFFNITKPSATIEDINLSNGKAAVASNAAKGGAINITVTTPAGSAETISTITVSNVTFDGNNATISAAGDVTATGGAIYSNNAQTVVISSSTFKSNTATATSTDGGLENALGGAIYKEGTGDLVIEKSTFEANEADRGGAVFGLGPNIQISSSTFKSNIATSDGGAIVALDAIEIKGSTFDSNEAGTSGGAIANYSSQALIKDSSFKNNTAASDGGAVYNQGTMEITQSSFTNNTATGMGGAIYNVGDLSSYSVLNLSGNSAAYGGGIYNDGILKAARITAEGNSATGDGGALFLSNTAGMSTTGTVYLSGTGSFTNNTAGGFGGAAYVEAYSVLTLESLDTITFRGNTDSTGANSIYLGALGRLNLNAAAGASIDIYDPIASANILSAITINGTHADYGYVPTGVTGTEGSINFYTDIPNFTGTLRSFGGTIGIFTDMTLNTESFSATNTTFNFMNNAINSLVINSDYTQTGSGYMKLDLDLKNGVSDTIEALGTVSGAALDVTDIRILTDSTVAATSAITVSNTFDITFDTSKTYYGPIFEYALSQPDTHSVIATKTDNFTPTVLGASIAQNSAALNNITVSNSLLNRVGVMLSKDGRYYNVKNSYSLSKYDKFVNKNPFATADITQGQYYTTWFVPYGAKQTYNFEDMNGDIDNNAYGANAGIDMPVMFLSDNVGFIPTVFAGYGNSTQKYNGLTEKRDAFTGGIMGTLYGPYFYISLEAHASDGTQTAEFQSYRDHFDLFTITSAARAEASIPLFWSMTLQPNISAAYNYVNAQDYTTGLGADMDISNLNNVQVTPGVKLSADIKSWHPYAAYAYTHNAYNDAGVNIVDFTLPEFKNKDYSEYTFGVENTFLETYSGYIQYTGYSQGISGFAVQMGLRGYIEF